MYFGELMFFHDPSAWSGFFTLILRLLSSSIFFLPPPEENNKPPVADAGPEKELTLPVDRTTLDGSKSRDDQKIATYHWKQTK